MKLGVPVGGILIPLIVGSAARLFTSPAALLAFPVLAMAGFAVVIATPAGALHD